MTVLPNCYGNGCGNMREFCVMLLLCVLFAGSSGCTIAPDHTIPGRQPVFSNGSVVTDGPWISLNPPADHNRSETFTMTGSTSLPAKSIIQVIIVQSGPSAEKIKKLDDCITEKQKCVLYFAKATGTADGISRWSITTDDSMNLFRNESLKRYTVIAGNTAGDLLARSEFNQT
jgi:hypothetical protein